MGQRTDKTNQDGPMCNPCAAAVRVSSTRILCEALCMSQLINPKDAVSLGVEIVELDPVPGGTAADATAFDATKTFAWPRKNVGAARADAEVGHILGRRGAVTAVARTLEELVQRLAEASKRTRTAEDSTSPNTCRKRALGGASNRRGRILCPTFCNRSIDLALAQRRRAHPLDSAKRRQLERSDDFFPARHSVGVALL